MSEPDRPADSRACPAVSAARYRLVARMGVVCMFTAGASALSLWPFWATNPVTGTIDLLVAVSLVATGVALLETGLHRATAWALVATALFWLVSWWWAWPPEWQVGPCALVSNVVGYLWFVCGGSALFRYPGAALSRLERTFLTTVACWVVLGKILIALVTEPEWERYSPWSWWPTLAPDRPLHDALVQVFQAGIVSSALVMSVLLLVKLQRSRGMDRLDALPVTVAAGAATVTGAAYVSARLFDFAPQTVEALRTSLGVAALATPLAFLMAVLRRRLAQSAVADLVVRIAGAPTVAQVERELRRVLDPTLVLWVWDSGRRLYVDASGGPCERPDAAGVWACDIRASSGAHLAVLLLDASLRRHPALVRSTLVATGLALEVQAQVGEINASRSRIAAAADHERRRIERDLHDGAQQRLLAVSAELSLARLQADAHPQVVAAIDQAHADLREAITELRRLARGIHPAVLSQSGLLPAVEDVAERLPLDVELNIPASRLDADIEVTIYFLTCEALTNTVRHAGTRRASVTVRPDDDAVQVLVADDGDGGARAVTGSGLAGIGDRVEALGGTMVIDSPAGGGTRIHAVLPCA